MPRVKWMAGGSTWILFNSCLSHRSIWMFSTSTSAWAQPGRAALWVPVSAISPSVNIFGYLEFLSCRIGFSLIYPITGLMIEPGSIESRLDTRPLSGVCTVARMTSCVVSPSPLVSLILNWLPLVLKPSLWTTTRLPMKRLTSCSENRFESCQPSGSNSPRQTEILGR